MSGWGDGKWGMLCREYLDVWAGRVFRPNWTTRIEGIEIFPTNIDTYHSSFYNKIHFADAYHHIHTYVQPDEFDLIILGDVLEHFGKEQATALLNTCILKAGHVLLNVPIGDQWPQGVVYGNVFETHLSVWTTKELDQFPVKEKRHFKDYIGRDFSTYLFSK